MKAAIYSPYLDTFGGGERYMMTIGEILSQDYTVDVFLDQHLQSLNGDYLKKELSTRFNLNLNKIRLVKGPFGKNSSAVSRGIILKGYDVLFYLTDGSIFYPTAKKNILHIQSPVVGQPAKNIWGKIKLKGWDLVIYNSVFTKQASLRNWPIKSEVVYPPVDVDQIKPLEKQKYILSVGRFFGYLKDKKHELLIQTFKKLYKDNKLQNWSLHLAGSAGAGDKDYLNQLRGLVKGIPVNFYPNISYDELIKLYGKSTIYWHAAGFEEEDPAKMEHFGIATVEAMAGGCVPVVIGKGGQREIVDSGTSGFLWNNLEDLEILTLKLIVDKDLWQQMSKKAQIQANKFSKDKFRQKILALV